MKPHTITLIAALALASCLLAQEAPPPSPNPQAPAPAAAPQTPPPQEPLLTSAENMQGEIQFGYRWLANQTGNFNVYRSVVNMGEGPKLFGGFFNLKNPKSGKFDRLDVDVQSWGGEPYSSARFGIAKDGVYDLRFSYRRISYFNDLPSFANPLLITASTLGYPLSQNAMDTQRRMFDVSLDVHPGSHIAPFFSYQRDAGTGPGLLPFIGAGDEFLSNVRYDDAQDIFRGGSHFNFNSWHLTVEAGGTRFHDDERLFYDGGPNPGNRRTPSFGINQFSTQDQETTRASGDGFFGRAFGTWRPLHWVDLSGTFGFSQPSLNVGYTESATGRFVDVSSLLAFTNSSATATSAAFRPHPSGSAGVELRPLKRLRIVQSIFFDNFHISSNALFTETRTGTTDAISGAVVPSTTTTDTDYRLFTNKYHRYQAEAFVEANSWLTVRGGYRRVWADANIPAALISLGGQELGKEQQHVLLAGLDLKPRKQISFHIEGEGASGTSSYFRTSPQDYHRLKFRARYKPRASMSITASFSLLHNENPTPDIAYALDSKQTAVTFFFAPQDGKHVSLSLEYMRSISDSNIRILLLPFLSPDFSAYLQDAHSASAFVNASLFKGLKAGLGGTLLLSDGTRPVRFYQPRMELSAPLKGKASWFSEWRYYGFREDGYNYEHFNSHLVAVGLRIKM